MPSDSSSRGEAEISLIHDSLEHWATTDPERICVIDGGRTISYRQMAGLVDRVAGGLGRLGVGDGDRIGVLARNCAEYIAVYYGAFRTGVVPVPLNFRLHPQEWASILGDSGAIAVLVQDEYVEQVEAIREAVAGVRRFVALDGDPPPGWITLDEPGTVAAGGLSPTRAALSADHDLWQMYTSGTTGRPKGAVITHAAAGANVAQFRAAVPIAALDRALVVMPLFHIAATLTTLPFIAAGASVRIVADFDPVECARIIDEEQITHAMLAPVMIGALLTSVADLLGRRFEHLRALVYGASPITEKTLRQAMDVFGCDFVQGYGQTEAGAMLTILDADAHRRALAGEGHLLQSCGRPVAGTEIAVVDTGGKPVPNGEVGEIIARGPQIMRAYWGMPAATDAALAGGWLHTGDAGRLDDEGFLYICDRIKDMIVSGGENVYPKEIEDVISALDGVAETAVIGVPDDRWGETVKALVVSKPGQGLTEESVITWCRAHLAGYKSPRSVDFVTALPRNASGKVLKTVLREPYWEGHTRKIG